MFWPTLANYTLGSGRGQGRTRPRKRGTLSLLGLALPNREYIYRGMYPPRGVFLSRPDKDSMLSTKSSSLCSCSYQTKCLDRNAHT